MKFAAKVHFFLHISKFFTNFAAQNVNNTIMKTQEPKQMPFQSENNGAGMPQKEYFTADEAMAFLEPRIRAMFR